MINRLDYKMRRYKNIKIYFIKITVRFKIKFKEKSPIPERKRRNSVKKTDTRELSPPPGEPSATVHITNLVRPFTLPQLKDFLAVHGEYSDFWIDKIKSNCFVKVNEK